MENSAFGQLLWFLWELDAANIHHTLAAPTASPPNGAIMVQVTVPGEYWEVEFHEDGDIGVEVFVSRNGVEGKEALDELFDRFSD